MRDVQDLAVIAGLLPPANECVELVSYRQRRPEVDGVEQVG